MKLQNFTLIALALISSVTAVAQREEKVDTLDVYGQRITSTEDGLFQLKKLKIGGYIQAQWQSTQLDSVAFDPAKAIKSNDMKSGTRTNLVEEIQRAKDYNRFGVRRGRLKATYEDFGCQGVIEFDISEGGLKTKDLYLNILDPWINTIALKGGVFDRPFGYEIGYSSSKLESPERSRIIQALFPDEKDLGAMLTIQAPKTSLWNALKLEVGLLSGASINKDYKSKKDLAAHLSYSNSTSSIKYGIGASMYAGSILLPNTYLYSVKNSAFEIDTTTNMNGYTKRTYYGLDGQFSIASDLGLSTIRAEYITGRQPGTDKSSSSPNATDLASNPPNTVYIRNFSGGYVTFVQDIADTKHSIVLKYDWYDPNTDLSGNKVVSTDIYNGLADMAYSTLGLGYMYRMNNNVRITAYYDIVTNEATKLTGYFSNVNDNLVTVRVQYKF